MRLWNNNLMINRSVQFSEFVIQNSWAVSTFDKCGIHLEPNMQVIYILQLVLTEGYWRQAKSAREGRTWGPVWSAQKQSSWSNPSYGPEGPLWQTQENRRVTRWPRHKWYSCCKAFRLFPLTLPVRRLAVQSHLSCDWYLEVTKRLVYKYQNWFYL